MLTAVWMTVLALARLAEANGSLTESAVFDPTGQTVLALIAVGACVVMFMNRQILFQEVTR